ncbi:ABC transporter ATP-binding protein [Staphylococcus saccharolyticus]|uniref:ABC transporter ATP-binding protein n=1 Tax=Staphylococcus saccharolyticus TaxID=33028 RepID=A0A380H7A1_9STAP|nr:ABC transporter ATP-binding protein [Staphylococcus saccharolyticus]
MIMSRIDTTETRLKEIEEEMVNASADYAKIKELNKEKQELEQTYEEDIMRWSELEEILEK